MAPIPLTHMPNERGGFFIQDPFIPSTGVFVCGLKLNKNPNSEFHHPQAIS
jgi:hypothetical protein